MNDKKIGVHTCGLDTLQHILVLFQTVCRHTAGEDTRTDTVDQDIAFGKGYSHGASEMHRCGLRWLVCR